MIALRFSKVVLIFIPFFNMHANLMITEVVLPEGPVPHGDLFFLATADIISVSSKDFENLKIQRR